MPTEQLTEIWKRSPVDINTDREISERKHQFAGLEVVGKTPTDECPICLVAFNSTEGSPNNITSSKNRLFACGCPGSHNKHVFHEYCLATTCSAYLRANGRSSEIYHWDTTRAGVPCPECRGLIGVREIPTLKVMYPEVLQRAGRRTKSKKNKSRRKKIKKV